MADPFEQAPPAAEREKHPREREPYEKVALWWRTIFPIAAFTVGALILLYEATRKQQSSTMIGVGLVLAGLGPAGLIDVIRKIP